MSFVAVQGSAAACPDDAHHLAPGFGPPEIHLPSGGVFSGGSLDTLVDGFPVQRGPGPLAVGPTQGALLSGIGDGGIHAPPCVGINVFTATATAVRTLVNGRPVVRLGDPTIHCANTPDDFLGVPWPGSPGTVTTASTWLVE